MGIILTIRQSNYPQCFEDSRFYEFSVSLVTLFFLLLLVTYSDVMFTNIAHGVATSVLICLLRQGLFGYRNLDNQEVLKHISVTFLF